MDHGILNVPLSKRGDIDAQLDKHKATQAKFAKQERIAADRFGVRHLFKGSLPRVFANRTQAENAASRAGGQAYQSRLSGRFLVKFAAA